MRIFFVQPRQELRPYIEAFWVFESRTGIPLTSRTLAVPNGSPKLIIPYENSLMGISEDRAGVSHEHGFYFVGNRIKSTHIHSGPRPTGFIGIEFAPQAAFRLFGIPMHETFEEKIFDSEELFGRWGRNTREALGNIDGVDRKIRFIQDELLGLSRRDQRNNSVVDFCVSTLKLAHGRISIKELERLTGYTRRYLNMLFKQHVGLPPKVLAGVYRFQMFYQNWAQGMSYELATARLYDYYYDQAHFSKEFKRMTGYSPREFMTDVPNEFGRRLAHK